MSTSVVIGPAVGSKLGPFTLVSKLGAGTFGVVYHARRGEEDFALKVSPLYDAGVKKPSGGKPRPKSTAAGLLYKEYLVLSQHFGWHPALPVVPSDSFGDDGVAWRWFATQRLRTTLRAALDGHPAPFSTVATLAIQLIDVLAQVHAKGWVYIDVNADNVMLGGAQPLRGMNAAPPPNKGGANNASAEERAYLIDFGLATQFRGFGTSKGLLAAETRGTPLFASTGGARGEPIAPRDDLESLGFLLTYAAAGRAALPWAEQATPELVAAVKAATPVASLALKLPAGAPRGALAAYWAALASAVAPASASAPAGTVDYARLKSIFSPFANKDGRLVWGGAGAVAGAGSGAGAGTEAGAPAVKAKEKRKRSTSAPSKRNRSSSVPPPVVSPPKASPPTSKKVPTPRLRGGGRTAIPSVVSPLPKACQPLTVKEPSPRVSRAIAYALASHGRK